jgi:hypothetical protein
LLFSPQAPYGPEEDALHHTVIYQAVAKHILTQCISTVLLLLLLLLLVVVVVVVSYFLVDSRNIWYACNHQKMLYNNSHTAVQCHSCFCFIFCVWQEYNMHALEDDGPGTYQAFEQEMLTLKYQIYFLLLFHHLLFLLVGI